MTKTTKIVKGQRGRSGRVVGYLPAYLYRWFDGFTKGMRISRSSMLMVLVRGAFDQSSKAMEKRTPASKGK